MTFGSIMSVSFTTKALYKCATWIGGCCRNCYWRIYIALRYGTSDTAPRLTKIRVNSIHFLLKKDETNEQLFNIVHILRKYKNEHVYEIWFGAIENNSIVENRLTYELEGSLNSRSWSRIGRIRYLSWINMAFRYCRPSLVRLKSIRHGRQLIFKICIDIIQNNNNEESKLIIISTIRENRRDRNTSLDVSRTYVNTEISSGGKQKEYTCW